MLYRTLYLCIFFLITPQLFAQTIESCSSIAADPDGDGFGWEHGQSCRVTDSSNRAPQFTNLETGQPVDLIRAFWTASDFSPFFICWKGYFDGTQYRIVRAATGFQHQPLSSVAPYVGEVNVTQPYDSDDAIVPWSIDYGIYTGPAEIAYTPWVEVVELDDNVTQAVRQWTSDYSYYFCTNPSPVSSLVPTGSAPVPDDIFGGECVDTDPVGDGWGWDGSTSCRI